MIALWQATTLAICLPATAATPATPEGESSCCEHRAAKPMPAREGAATCVHCTDGRGQFAEPARRAAAATPFAFVAMLPALPSLEPAATPRVTRSLFDPLWPDPPPESLFDLSVAQLR